MYYDSSKWLFLAQHLPSTVEEFKRPCIALLNIPTIFIEKVGDAWIESYKDRFSQDTEGLYYINPLCSTQLWPSLPQGLGKCSNYNY